MGKKKRKRGKLESAALGGMLASVLGLFVVVALAGSVNHAPGAVSSESAELVATSSLESASSSASASAPAGVPAQKLSAEELDALIAERQESSSGGADEPEAVGDPGASDDLDAADGVAATSDDRVLPAVTMPAENALATAASEGKLIVRFLDVGQGDCALISCNGHHMLIDGGPSRASQKVYTVLKNLGIDYLDYIVATHADADHVGGISAALNAASCGVCYCSVEASDTRTFESMTRYVRGTGAPFVVPEIPTVLDLGGAQLSIIGPVQAFPESDNNGSLVCRIDFGQTSFLFMGDAEEEAENALVKSGANLAADVLKVGHHGSSHSTTGALVRAVQPSYAVISVGADNPYGHPTERVLGLLQQEGAEVFRTDLDGDVVATSDGQTIDIQSVVGNITE